MNDDKLIDDSGLHVLNETQPGSHPDGADYSANTQRKEFLGGGTLSRKEKLDKGPDMPGGPAQFRGKSWKDEGDNNPPPNESDNNGQPFTELEVQRLKLIREKCRPLDEGQAPRFGVEVNFDEDEVALTEKLIAEAQTTHQTLADKTPHYDRFQALFSELTGKIGTFGISKNIIEDPVATEPSKILIPRDDKNIPGIRVPSSIYRLYQWGLTISDTTETMQHYKAGVAKGRNTKQFGESIYNIYRFVKESHQGDKNVS